MLLLMPVTIGAWECDDEPGDKQRRTSGKLWPHGPRLDRYVSGNFAVQWSCSLHEVWDMVMGQNPVPLVNIKIAGEWMFIHPNMAP